MAKIKVRNISNTTVIVPNGKGGDIILNPGEEREIEGKYFKFYSGKLIEVKDEEIKGKKESKKQGGNKK